MRKCTQIACGISSVQINTVRDCGDTRGVWRHAVFRGCQVLRVKSGLTRFSIKTCSCGWSIDNGLVGARLCRLDFFFIFFLTIMKLLQGIYQGVPQFQVPPIDISILHTFWVMMGNQYQLIFFHSHLFVIINMKLHLRILGTLSRINTENRSLKFKGGFIMYL